MSKQINQSKQPISTEDAIGPEKPYKALTADVVAEAYWETLDMIKALESAGYSAQVARRNSPKWGKNERVAQLVLHRSKTEYLLALKECAKGALKKENVDAAERLYAELCKIWQPRLSSDTKSNENNDW